jgi:hypothetical protein
MSVTLDDCFNIGLTIHCLCISTKFKNVHSPLIWMCQRCGNKFNESYINIKNNNRGCLKCSYNKFNKK